MGNINIEVIETISSLLGISDINRKLVEMDEKLNLLVKERDEYLTVEEVCKILKISRNTFENYWRTEKLKTYKIGGKRLVKASELRETIEKCTTT